MPPRRRIDPAAGAAAFARWRGDPDAAPREVVALAVRWSLEELAARHPGRATEVRVPPLAAVQCLPGTTHTRGTPPNVVETDPATWLALAAGLSTWAEAVHAGRVSASGQRADLSGCLPLTPAG